MSKEFIGRFGELNLLDNIWKTHSASLIILYGRRRVGKTRLLTHWLRQRGADGFYWMAEPTSAVDQLRSFSQALANFADPESVAPEDFTYASWEQALRQVSLLSRDRRIALFIDEVTYLIDINPTITGTFQKVWDQWLKDSNVMLALSGSLMGVMQKQILSYQAPLYGRATAQVKLPPLPFSVTREYFPSYSTADRVLIYATWGGVPAYWERLDPQLSVLENLRVQLQPSNTWMLDEPRLLLQDFITDLYNYVGIMRAITNGAQTISDIGNRNGLSSSHMSSYLSILRDTGFIERRVPVTERSAESRRGRYFVTDPFLRFYYRYLAAYQSKLALGQQKQMMASIEQSLPEFISSNTWQELCREWLLLASANDVIPVPVEHVGSEWKRTLSVDVLGIDETAKSLVLGCCYWNTQPASLEEIRELVKKTAQVVPEEGDWSVFYVGFASSGWTQEAMTQAESIVMGDKTSRAKRKWLPVGVRLISLAELDEDMAQWTKGDN